MLIAPGLTAAVGGAGMIVIGPLAGATDVAWAGGAWAVLGLMRTFVGFRLRVVPPRPGRR